MLERHATSNAFSRRLASLVPLTDSDLLAVLRRTAQPYTVQADIDLAVPGTQIDHAFIVLDGFACRYKLRKDGRRQILAYLLPGDVSDIDCVILDRMTHAIGTLSQCTVVQVPEAALLDLSGRHPSVNQALRLAKSIDEAITREWIMQLGCFRASERMAHLLCELLVRLQTVGLVRNNSYDLPLTQSVLGDTLGLSSVHVNRSLQALRHAGWISLDHGRLRIHDLEHLKEHAEFSADYLFGKRRM